MTHEIAKRQMNINCLRLMASQRRQRFYRFVVFFQSIKRFCAANFG